MRKWIPWVPVLMFGSLVYWTVALNFGGLSLMRLTYSLIPGPGDLTLSDDDFVAKDSFQPITVHLTGQDELGSRTADGDSLLVDIVPDREAARADQKGAGDRGGRADQGPGATAF